MKYILCFFILISVTMAQELVIHHKKIPKEMALLIDCLWTNTKNDSRKFELLSSLSSMNSQLNYLSPASLNFIAKSEIYKFLMERDFFSEHISNYPLVQPQDYSKMTSSLKKIPSSFCGFNQWVFKAMNSDLEQIIESQAIDKFYQYNAGKPDSNVERLVKISKYIGPWLTAYRYLEPSLIEKITIEHYQHLLTHLQTVTSYYQAFTQSHYQEPQTFFDLPTLKPSEMEQVKVKSLDDVLKSIPEEESGAKSKVDQLFKDLDLRKSN